MRLRGPHLWALASLCRFGVCPEVWLRAGGGTGHGRGPDPLRMMSQDEPWWVREAWVETGAGTEGLNCPHLLLISALAALPSGSLWGGRAQGPLVSSFLGSRSRAGFMGLPPRQSPRAWCSEGLCAYFSALLSLS